MGNRETKADVDDFLKLAGGAQGDRSKEELALYLSSLSDMADTGMTAALPESASAPGRWSLGMSPRTGRRMRDNIRKKLEKQSASLDIDDSRKQLKLLDNLLGQEPDSTNWASMRDWLVWCMQNNLGNEDEVDDLELATERTRRLSRQVSMDQQRGRKLSYQSAVELTNDGKMSAQSSLESNAET